MNNVKNYTDKQLLNQVRSLSSFQGFPLGYWLLAVRSNEDAYDTFDDKVYLFKHKTFVDVATCTTNSGGYGLLNFSKWNKKGTAIIKSDEWYYDCYQYGLHKGKMEALRQVGNMKYYRDSNKDRKIDETGEITVGINYTNFHCNDYVQKKGVKSWFIGGWSTGCVVVNNLNKYYDSFMAVFRRSKEKVTMCLIKEF